jgi:FixJ family two-component response regulator
MSSMASFGEECDSGESVCRMDGLELQLHLAAQSCDVPIVLVTAHGEAENRMRAVQNGAIAFLGKPLNDEH